MRTTMRVILLSVDDLHGFVDDSPAPVFFGQLFLCRVAGGSGEACSGPATYAALQSITPNQMRGQVTALFLLVFNVIGFGLGPTIIAFFTDFVFHSNAKVGYSMAATVAILAPLGVLPIWLSLKPYGRCTAEARAWN